jgi:hypothetical protein
MAKLSIRVKRSQEGMAIDGAVHGGSATPGQFVADSLGQKKKRPRLILAWVGRTEQFCLECGQSFSCHFWISARHKQSRPHFIPA